MFWTSSSELAPRWPVVALVTLIWAGLYLPGLGETELEGTEAQRILPALHMLESGNWVQPYLVGKPYYSKPPLINWLIVSGIVLTGDVSEWSARISTAVLVLAYTLLVVLMPSRWLSFPGRVVAALALITGVAFIEKCRLAEVDGLYVLLTGAAQLTWLNLWTAKRKSWWTWLVPSVFLGLGLLVKGPLVLLYFYITVLSVVWYQKRWRDLLSWRHALGLALALAVFFAWAQASSVDTPSVERDSVWIYEMWTRFKPHHLDLWFWFQNVVRAVINFLPWLVFVPFFWHRDWVKHIDSEHLALFKGCRLSLVIGFIVTNILPGVRERYSMPLFCVAALLVGWILIVQPYRAWLIKLWRFAVLCTFGLCAVAATGALVLIVSGVVPALVALIPMDVVRGMPFDDAVYSLPWGGVVALFCWMALVGVWLVRSQLTGPVRLSLATGVVTVVGMVLTVYFAIPLMQHFERRRPVGRMVRARVPPGEVVHALDITYEPYLYYVRPVAYPRKARFLDPRAKYLIVEDILWPAYGTNPRVTNRCPRPLLKYRYKATGYTLYKLTPAGGIVD
jgi:4-amino-4-deoxy-L-arabinose transferase-like glycosyltransferase